MIRSIWGVRRGRRFSPQFGSPASGSSSVPFESLEARRLFCLEHLASSIGVTFWDTSAATTTEAQLTAPTSASDTTFAESVLPTATELDAPSGLPYLHSLPGAPTAVFLDFDGFGNNTSYDTDGNPASFGTGEQADVREAWRHVASYFAMFNTDVTTQPPTVPYSYSIISNSLNGPNAVGFSYSQFPTTSPSAFNPATDAKTRQSGMAHEIGHNFGLAHQSDYDLLGNKTAEYTNGYDSLHGAIMGADFSQNVHKWFIGHPASSASALQDDVAVIASRIRGIGGGDGFRTDDVPNIIASARALTATNNVYTTSGIIERMGDADAYSFNAQGGQTRFDLTLQYPSMLDAKLEVYDADGTLVGASDTATNDQHLTAPSLAAGTYFVMVKSHGDYGDLGQYNLSITAAVGTPVEPPAGALPSPVNVAFARGTGTAVTLSWDPVDGATGYEVQRSANGFAWTTVGTNAAGDVDYADASLAGGLRYFYRVSALGAAGRSLPSEVATVVTRPSSVTNFSITSLDTGTLVLNWRDVSGESGYRVERYNAATSTWAGLGTVGVNVPSFANTGLAAGTSYRYRVIPTSPFGDGNPVEASAVTRLPAAGGLTFTAKESNRMGLRWNAATGAANYRIERSTDGKTFSTLTTVSGTTYDDRAVQPLKEYYYRVLSVNGAGAVGLNGSTVFAASPASAAQTLPAAWSTRDIGGVGGTGAAGVSGGTFTLVGGGADIWDSADAFRYVYQPLTGNGEIVARVASQEDTAGFAKAGVMVRENLNANARHAMMVMTPGNGAAFQYRNTAGGASTNSNGGTFKAPYWVRLVRSGNTFTGYYSANGTTWTQQGSTTISMGTNTFVGLAIVPGNNARLGTVTFTNVTLSNRAPTVVTAAAASPAVVTGTTADLSVLGADDHGEANLGYFWSVLSGPDGAPLPTFSADGANAAKNVTATFYRPGSYVLRATARDAGGMTVTSDVSVEVMATPTGISVTPAAPSVMAGQTLRLSAAVVDQFGQPVSPAPQVYWTAGAGTIADDGTFTAPAQVGRVQVEAATDLLAQDVSVEVIAFDATPPMLVAASSRKVHGALGEFDLPLALSGRTTVEPRAGGPTTVRLVFSEPVFAEDGVLDANEFGVENAALASVAFDPAGGGSAIVLNLAGVVDGRTVTVVFAGLVDSIGLGLAGQSDVSVAGLYGDADGDGVVDSADVFAVRNALLRPLSAANCAADLDLTGSLDSRDLLVPRERLGARLL